MSDPAPLRLVDVTVAHERTPVVRELSLVVEPHGVVSLTGASGSGKSTVLAVVAGIIPHSRAGTVSGRVLHHGRDVTHEAPWERSSWLGFLAQDPASSLCLTHVDDELALPLENAGVPREEIGPRVTAIAQRLGIEHLVGRRTSQLSGGEQQRVALAATLVSNPEVVLLDEPLSMLDPQAAVDVSSLLHQELRGEGPAAVIVEHRARELRDAGVVADTQVRLGDDNAQGAELWWVDQPQLSTERPPAADPDREVVLDRHLSDLRRDPEGPVILDEFSVRLRSASITALLGPNGSGKSTLLMALAGVLPGMTPDERVAMVFQRPENQFITNTVLDEVSFGTTRERARELLALVGLEGLEERSPHQLSLGQQRRLSVVAVAAQGDPVLLLDEPTFGLDDAGAAAVAELIVALRDEGRAILLATHDLSLAGRLADARLELTERPSLTRAAPPEKIPDSPLSRVSPMLKLGATLLTSLGLLFTLAFWPVLAVAGLATLAVPLLARVPLRRVVRFQLPIYWFAASTLIVNLASRGTWQAGLESGLALAARTLAIGGLACLFVLSTDAIRFVNSAHQQAGVPARHAYALLAGYRLLEVLPDEWRTIRAAHATRTRHLGSGRISWLKGFARSGFSLLVVSLRRGQQLSEALEARGLGRSPRTIWKPVRWGWRDMVFALVCLIAVGLAVWSVRWPS